MSELVSKTLVDAYGTDGVVRVRGVLDAGEVEQHPLVPVVWSTPA